MNLENEIYNDISKSISKKSEYSEALENYEDIVRYSNINNIKEKKNSNKEANSFYEDFSEGQNISIIKERNSNNLNDDINEVDVISLFKRKSNDNQSAQIYKRKNPIKSIHSHNITNNLNINEIKEEKNEELNNDKIKDLDEKIYSDVEHDKSLHNVDSEIKILNLEKNQEIKVTKITKPTNNNEINFDFNLEPLDTISINTDNKLKNKKKKYLKKTFKKLLTFNNTKSDKRGTGNELMKKISVETKSIRPSEFSKSLRRKKKDFFDPNNILRKAVIMNGKKRNKNNNNLRNSMESEISNKFNISINDEQYPINNIKFDRIKIDELNTNHLKTYLRVIDVTSKREDSKKNFFKTLIELQNFYIDNSSIWVIKLSQNGRYLACGCKSGKIKIYEVIGYNYSGFKTSYDRNNIFEYLKFIPETPYKTLAKHKADVIDLAWSPFFPNLLLSASLDHFVYLWDIYQEDTKCLVKEYEHSDIVTSVCFNPYFKNVFMSGCLEHFVQIWKFDLFDGLNFYSENNEGIITSLDVQIYNKSEKKNLKNDKEINNSFGDADRTNANLDTQNNDDTIYYFNIRHKITSVAFFPDGLRIAIGAEKGKIFVYNTFPRINYSHNFYVAKKKFKIFHFGKKVTNIQFISKDYALVTTADSVIRYVHMNKGSIISEYRGYKNDYSMTRAHADLVDDVIIIGGEDSNCYVWKIYEEKRQEKNKIYESFKPFSKETIECSIIAHEKCYINYMQKMLKLTNKILVLNIIINGTSNGRLEILLNIKEDE